MYPDAASAAEAVQHRLHEAPAAYGQMGTRWRLASVLVTLGSWKVHSVGGLSRLLRRLKIRLKQARGHVHSPDPHYRDKLRSIWIMVQRVRLPVDPRRVLFEDEFTFFRQPRLGPAYEPQGRTQPLAALGWTSNRIWRVAATLNAATGQVLYTQGSQISRAKLVQFYAQVQHADPTAAEIVLVQDNWPVHFHPDVLAALQPQTFPWGLKVPASWPTTPSPRVKRLNLPVRLLPLPTYASWANPIEKLWRWLTQDVLRLHRFADDWAGLKRAVGAFLDQFAHGSTDLLRYVGLHDPTRLYRALFAPEAALA